MRKMFFMAREMRCWNRLPTQVMVTTSLGLFKARVVGALWCSLVLWEVSVLVSGSWTWSLKVPSNSNLSDSVKSHGFSSFLSFVPWCGSLWSLYFPVNACKYSLLSCHKLIILKDASLLSALPLGNIKSLYKFVQLIWSLLRPFELFYLTLYKQ